MKNYFRLVLRDDLTVGVAEIVPGMEYEYKPKRFLNGERYDTWEEAQYNAEWFMFHPELMREERLAYLRGLAYDARQQIEEGR